MADLTDGANDPGLLHHGGRLAQARRLFPGAPEPFLDLSTGISPFAYPMPVLPETAFTRLPEPEAVLDLQTAAAAAYGARDAAMVAAGGGTQALIGLLPLLRPPGRVGVLGPTYAEHAAAWRAAGHALIAPEIAPDGPDRPDVLVLCNPNNPDGRRIGRDTLALWAARQAAHGGWLVVDEAFADFEPPGLSAAPLLPLPGLIVLRSFGKAYGLAGLRLGFALAEPTLAARIRTACGPWAVSGPALAVAATALRDAPWRAASARRLMQGAALLDAALHAAGLAVLGGTHLFRLARAGTEPEAGDAARRFHRLGRAGILVRRFEAQPDWLRFGIPPTEAALARLRAAL